MQGVQKTRQPEIPPEAEAPLIIGEVRPTIDYANVYKGKDLKQLAPGDFANIDRQTSEKFRRGAFKIERRLDLHGLSEKEAFEAVDAFIRDAYLHNKRCVLIITGKGLKKEDDAWYEKKGILKECVPGWLNAPGLRPLILAICSALPEDGGEGALYVLLRRHRDSHTRAIF